jgi:enoyl-CoA hydratase
MYYIEFEKREHIGILTINNSSKLNALNFEVLDDFNNVLDVIREDKEIFCLIITGTGEKAFIAGGDIALQNSFDVMQAKGWSHRGQACLRKLETMPMPVIGAINGFALGGGLEVALACDILIASENAIFGQPEVCLGIIPGFGGTQRLPRKIGLNKAKELIFTGNKIDVAEALKIGLISKAVPSTSLMEETLILAESIIKNAPIAVRQAKIAINEGIQCDLDRGLSIEKSLFSECFSTDDKTTGMSAFINKNKNVCFKNQ